MTQQIDEQDLENKIDHVLKNFPISPDGDILGGRGMDYVRLKKSLVSYLVVRAHEWIKVI